MNSQHGLLASATSSPPTRRRESNNTSAFLCQVCREAGARVRTNTLNLEQVNVLYGRRLEVVADGLTLWHGARLAIECTRMAADRSGEALKQARRLKETTSFQEKEVKHAWRCSLQKLGGNGPKSLLSSCALSPKLTPKQHPKFSRTASKRHGSSDGATSWLAARQGFCIVSPGQPPECRYWAWGASGGRSVGGQQVCFR